MSEEQTKQRELRRVMVIAAHPDDPEFGCAGTVAKMARDGKHVTYVLLTSGDKGSHDPTIRPGQIAALREDEQRSAAQAIGVEDVVFLHHPDGILENSLELRRQLALLIREYQPDILFAIDPWRPYQLHPDHRAAGLAAIDAAWSAREWNIFPEQLLGEREPWRVAELYLFWTDNPDHWEDVSSTIDLRIAAVSRHTSQVGQRVEQVEKNLREWTRKAAEGRDLEYAESYKKIKL